MLELRLRKCTRYNLRVADSLEIAIPDGSAARQDEGGRSFTFEGAETCRILAFDKISFLSPKCRFETLEITLPERVEIIGVDTIFFDSILSNRTDDNFRVGNSSVCNKSSRP